EESRTLGPIRLELGHRTSDECWDSQWPQSIFRASVKMTIKHDEHLPNGARWIQKRKAISKVE
ncbi:MAG: hypothetical protein AAB243_02740, partial [Planctomycetota bacterium]